MDCTEVRELLSAYYDAELASNERAAVADHLTECPKCWQERANFANLSGMVRRWETPVPPVQMWYEIQEQLDLELSDQPISRSKRSESAAHLRRAGGRLRHPIPAVAALVLVALGWFAFDQWPAPGKSNLLAADFARYVDEFQRNPDAAQQELLAKYDGHKIDLSEAKQRVGYQPIVANTMPEEYTLDSVYLLKMPCCDCLQTVCQRRDGTKIAIFEYGEEQPVSFGNRPESLAQCHGKSCRLFEISEQFAVSWKQSGRQISLVGARDQAEIENLVAWLN